MRRTGKAFVSVTKFVILCEEQVDVRFVCGDKTGGSVPFHYDFWI